MIFLSSAGFGFAAEGNATASDAGLDMQADEIPSAEDGGNETVTADRISERTENYVTYQATITYVNGTPFADRPVHIDVENDDNYYRETDSNGTASVNLYWLENGNYNVTIYSEDHNVIHTSSFKVFDVVKSCKFPSCHYDDGAFYKVRVYGDDGKPLKGAKVIFNVGKKKYTKTSDKDGYAKLKITFKPGEYEIKATYKKYTIHKDITVKNPLKVLTKFQGKTLKSKFKFKVKFLGKNKKNKKITVKFNKKTYTAKTNKNGIAAFNIKTPRSLTSYKHDIVVKYKSVSKHCRLGWGVSPPKVYFYLYEV